MTGNPETESSTALTVAPDDRLLVLAPHPDDESVATGGLLIAARRAGAAVRLIFMTDGDNNPWAQRGFEWRLWIGARDRARFAAIRREEIQAALIVLGISSDDIVFLALPDQGVTGLLLRSSPRVTSAVRAEIAAFAPTLVVLPSRHDLHPDHSATAVVAELALGRVPAVDPAPRILRYLVHNPGVRRSGAAPLRLALDAVSRERKHRAIACHHSQLFWRRSFLYSFATSAEPYFDEEPAVPHPVGGLTACGEFFTVAIRSQHLARAFGRRSLAFAGSDEAGNEFRWLVVLPAIRGRAPVCDARDGSVLAIGSFEGRPSHGYIVIPQAVVPRSGPLFAKLEHSFGFFDEAGWTRLR